MNPTLMLAAIGRIIVGLARLGAGIIAVIVRCICYLLLALAVAFFLHFVIGPLFAGISIPVLLLILILNSPQIIIVEKRS